MKKSNTWVVLALLAVGTVFTGCKKDDPEEFTPAPNDRKAYISYEGNFQQANAGLTVKNLTTGAVTSDVYSEVNGEQLGSTLQSVTGIGDNLYLCVSALAEGINPRVVVINKSSLKKVGEIPCANPQFISAIGNNQALVTNYTYGGVNMSVDLIDLENNTITKSIPITGAARQIVTVENKSYFVNGDKAYLYVIDHTSFTITDSIEVGSPASGVVVDENNKLWVGIGQAWGSTEKGKLLKINPTNNTVELSLEATEKVSKLAYSPTEDAVIYVDGGAVYEMSISATVLPVQSLATLSATAFYGLGVDGQTGDIYISDALNFSSPAEINQFSKDGTLKATFTAGGASASGFWFE